MSVNSNPVVASHGTFDGNLMGAVVLLEADINFQKLINTLEATAAEFATALANKQTQIQSELGTADSKYFINDGIAAIEAKIRGGQTLTDDDQKALEDYTQQISIRQSEIQAQVKGLDPVLTTEQNLPSALQQGANEFIQEVGTVNQGLQALANDKIG
jgi:hypothetical protein